MGRVWASHSQARLEEDDRATQTLGDDTLSKLSPSIGRDLSSQRASLVHCLIGPLEYLVFFSTYFIEEATESLNGSIICSRQHDQSASRTGKCLSLYTVTPTVFHSVNMWKDWESFLCTEWGPLHPKLGISSNTLPVPQDPPPCQHQTVVLIASVAQVPWVPAVQAAGSGAGAPSCVLVSSMSGFRHPGNTALGRPSHSWDWGVTQRGRKTSSLPTSPRGVVSQHFSPRSHEAESLWGTQAYMPLTSAAITVKATSEDIHLEAFAVGSNPGF